MTALMPRHWLLGLTLLALVSAGPAFAQAPPPSFVYTFDENGHGSVTLPDGTVVPLPGFISLDPVLGVPALSYGPLPTLATNGFVGLLVTPGEGLSDVLDFFNHFVYFYSDPLPPETVADLADTPGFFNASGLVSKTIPEVGAEGANGALYVPGVFDPGFASVEFPASYNIISDNAAGRTVPAPSSLTLLATGAGLAGLVRVTWRRHRRT